MAPHLEKIKRLLSLPSMKEFSLISRRLSRETESKVAESTVEPLPFKHQMFLPVGGFDTSQLVGFPAVRLADPVVLVANVTEIDTASAEEITHIGLRGVIT